MVTIYTFPILQAKIVIAVMHQEPCEAKSG